MPIVASVPRPLRRRLLVIPFVVLAALAQVVAFAAPASAAAGDLDPSFDTDGKVVTDLGSTDDEGRDVVVQPDGKIVVAGYAAGAGGLAGYGFVVVRYNANGSLDTSFDADGMVFTDFTANSDVAAALVLQPDGKIVVAGIAVTGGPASIDFALARYNPNGSLDTSFDTDGKVVTDFASSSDDAQDLVLQGDGKLVVVGDSTSAGATDFAAVRYNANGSLDTTFDTDGKVLTDVGSTGESVGGGALQPDGRLVVSGATFIGGPAGNDVAVVRYNANGSLDTSFDTDGKVVTAVGTASDFGASVAVTPAGKLVVSAQAGPDVAALRYNPNGSLDPTFDSDGIVTVDIGGAFDFANDVLLQADGKIILVADSDGPLPATDGFALARFNPNGALDTTFSGDGKVVTDFAAGDDQGQAGALQADGKIVVAGLVSGGGGIDVGVARYLGDPAVTANDPVVPEGTGGATTASVTVALSAAHTAAVTVQYATADGTATAGSDYTTVAASVTFAAGETTKTIAVPVNPDAMVEPSETLFVNLSSPTNAAVLDPQSLVTIGDDDGGSGYWLVASDGGIFSFGVPFYGSTGALRLNKPIVGMAATPSGNGYFLVASDGGIFAFGDAVFQGSTGALTLNKPIVGMATTPSGKGYFLVASDGGIFAFGDAVFQGSTGALRLNKPIVGMATTPTGKGYFLVASDGGIFAFGDAVFQGSTGALTLNKPIVGMATTPTGKGYFLVASDGGIFAFGDAVFQGSTGALRLNKPIVGVETTNTGKGYWLVATDGGIFAFGDAVFQGSTGALTLNKPILGMAAR